MCNTIDKLVRMKRKLEDLLKEGVNNHLQNAVLSIEKYLSETCKHDRVRDYIDINPETSIPIEYCSICFTTF
uniref:Uncharacterized protein n=1 Tax=viral metagenome TaxID=1070528 RepID=A0A6C0B6X3_9ZZZZ